MAADRLRSLGTRFSGFVERRLRIDIRALAAFRIALGLLVLADLLRRSRSLRAFYTDFGVLPRSALVETADPLHLSLHLVSGDARIQALLFLLAAALAVALTVGYRTRIATVGSWVMLVSLHNRMPDVLNGGDVLLRLLLFWAMFLPLGACWAVDSRHRSADRQRTHVASVAGAALLCQVVAVYLTNAALKLSGDVWLRGDGLEYAFSLGQFTILLGDVLGAYPTLLSALDYLWLALVATAFLLIVLPGRLRIALVALFAAAHVGMLLTMRLDLFPLISMASLLPFLPTRFWDAAESRFPRSRPAAVGRRWARRLADGLPVVTVSDVPPVLHRWKGRFTTVVPLVFLVLVVLWNLQVLGVGAVVDRDVVPEAAEPAIELTRTDQYWTMFAPEPLSTDGWIVAPGHLENGSRVDAFHGGPVEWDRPPDVSRTYPTARWRKYLVGLWRGGAADRQHFADYLCRRWNSRHDTELENVSVSFVEQPTRLDAAQEPVERDRLAEREC